MSRLSMDRLAGALLACLLAGAMPAHALTAPAGDAAMVPADTQSLYREALQAIADGRNDDASGMLRRVIDLEPLHAGAWLDLALIQCSLGRRDEAERLFVLIEQRFQPPPEIQKLIDESRARGCNKAPARNQYMITVGRGIDQNVNQGAESAVYQPDNTDAGLILLPEFLPQHDQYVQVTADYLQELTQNGVVGYLQFQGRRHDRLERYDTGLVYAGIEAPWRLGRWTLRTSFNLGAMTLGGQYYQRQASVQANIGPPLPLPNNVQFNLTTGLTHVDYLTLSNFTGNTAELRGQFTYRSGLTYASASFGMQNDHGAAARPGGDRHGDSVALVLRSGLPAGSTGELSWLRQSWRSQTPYAPGLINDVRDQATQVLRATFTYPISKRQNVQLEVRQVNNHENISIFQYRNRQLQLNWQWLGL